MPNLAFDPDRHVYTVDGREVPGVTSILRSVGLIDTEWVSDEGLIRGTYVHQAIQFDNEGDLDESTLAPEIRLKVEAYRKWKNEMRVEVLGCELHVFHPHLYYCGTMDLHARVQGAPYIIDLKSGTPQRWHRLQTAAYALAHQAQKGPKAERLPRAALYLQDGDYRWTPHPHPFDYDGWKAALTLRNWKEIV